MHCSLQPIEHSVERIKVMSQDFLLHKNYIAFLLSECDCCSNCSATNSIPCSEGYFYNTTSQGCRACPIGFLYVY